MKISPAAELAVRGMAVLAKEYGKGPTPLLNICSARDLPKEYLTKIFGLLTKGNLVTPIRGKNGGYKLARDPSQITLLEIVEAVEGPIVVNLCQHTPPRCDQGDCPFRPVWEDLQKTIRSKLGMVKLSQAAAYTGTKRGAHSVISDMPDIKDVPTILPGQLPPDHHRPGLNT